MGRASAFYVQKRRASSPSTAATSIASSVLLDMEAAIPLIIHSLVALSSLLVMSLTNSLLAGCTSLLLGVVYQCQQARGPSAAAHLSNVEADGASVPRWDRRSLGGSSSEDEQAELQPEQHAERGEGLVSPDESFTLVRAGPARASTAVAVASLDAAKLAAVRAALEAWFGGAVEATGVEATGDRDAGTGLLQAGMHIGMQHTFEGCAARMQQLLLAGGGSGGSADGSAAHARPDFLVAVECGVIPIVTQTTTSGHEVACVMVMDVASQRTRHAFSQTRPYPLAIVQEMARQGMSAAEVADFCAAHYEKAELTCSHADQIRTCTQLVLSDLLPPQPGMSGGGE